VYARGVFVRVPKPATSPIARRCPATQTTPPPQNPKKKQTKNPKVDILDVGATPAPIGSTYKARILGCLAMIDKNETDWCALRLLRLRLWLWLWLACC
jgi:hypothetical protein